jgi:hypothetical protein
MQVPAPAGEEPAAEPEAPASPMEQEEEAEGGHGVYGGFAGAEPVVTACVWGGCGDRWF